MGLTTSCEIAPFEEIPLPQPSTQSPTQPPPQPPTQPPSQPPTKTLSQLNLFRVKNMDYWRKFVFDTRVHH